jgi:hypothetical protein
MRVSANGVRALNAQPRKVPSAWLNALPAGHDFSGPKVVGLGKKVRAGGKVAATVGQVFTVPAVPGTPARWYVLLSDGLAPITAVQARLLLEDPNSRKAYGSRPALPITIDAASANASPSKQNVLDRSLPTAMPTMMDPPASTPLCLTYPNTQTGSVVAKVTVGGDVAIPTPPSTGNQDRFDQVLLPPGGAVIAGLLPGEGQLGAVATSLSLISDQGVRYSVPSADVLTKLGYDASDITPVPASILRLIPQGPTLDPAAARTPMNVLSG